MNDTQTPASCHACTRPADHRVSGKYWCLVCWYKDQADMWRRKYNFVRIIISWFAITIGVAALICWWYT